MTHPHLTIRSCTAEDLPKIQEIEDLSFDEPYPPSLFAAFLESHPLEFRVAVIEGNLVGYCVLGNWSDEHSMVIASLAVHPKFKRIGVGSELLKDALTRIRVNSPRVRRIVLQVAVENEAARALYGKFGFVKTATLKDYYGRRRDGIQMELDLTGSPTPKN